MCSLNRTAGALAATLLAALCPYSEASADGNFAQLDATGTTTVAVATTTTGRLSFSGTFVDYDDGARRIASFTYAVPVGKGWIARIGPTFGAIEDAAGARNIELGARASLERYQSTDFGGLFLLADVNTIEQAWFLLVQASLDGGFGVEISRGGSETYDETGLALSRRLGDGPVSLRLGFRFDAQEAFVGISVNTF